MGTTLIETPEHEYKLLTFKKTYIPISFSHKEF